MKQKDTMKRISKMEENLRMSLKLAKKMFEQVPCFDQ